VKSRLLLFAVVLISFGTTARADAQSSPSPSPAPLASSPAVGQPVQPVAAPPAKPALAGHLPIIEFDTQADFANPPSTTNTTGTGLNGVVSGTIDFAGSFTIPVYKNISIAYARDAGSFLNSTFSRIAVGGKYVMVGSLKRHTDTEKIDIGIVKGLTLEAGFEHNDFECCLPLEFHTGYAALQYAAPPIKALNGLSFIYIEKGMTAAHNPPAAQIAADAAAGTPDVKGREYGTDQILVGVLPISKGFYATGLYLNGAYDFFEQEPYPYRFNAFIETADFTVNKNVTFELGTSNVTQQNNQGSPFPATNGIHFVNFYTTLKLKLDTNTLVK
jgi:hypothetical protein